MKSVKLLALLFAIGLGACLLGLPGLARAQGPDTSFTYQGRLLKDGSYVDGVTCNFEFRL